MRLILGKALAAFAASLMVFLSFWSLLSKINFFGPPGNIWEGVPALLLALGGCALLAWSSSRSVGRALLAGLAALVFGLLAAFFLVTPFMLNLVGQIPPLAKLAQSGSFPGLWFFWVLVCLIEAFSLPLHRGQRWMGWLAGALLGAAIPLAVELATILLPTTNELDFLRLAIEAPLIWITVSVCTSLPPVLFKPSDQTTE